MAIKNRNPRATASVNPVAPPPAPNFAADRAQERPPRVATLSAADAAAGAQGAAWELDAMLKLAVDLNGARVPGIADHLAMFNEYQLRGCLCRMQGLCDIILEHDFGTTPATAPADEREGEPTQCPDDTVPLRDAATQAEGGAA